MGTDKPLSIRDIAQMAGVSIATVSRVINNKGRFSEETARRVRQIIDESGYVANAAARNLRESHTKTIGMIVPDISNDFFSALALHAEQALSQKGYSVFVCNDANSTEREHRYIRTLVSKRVDGIICISGSHALRDETIPSSIPVVCVDRYPGVDSLIPRVISDDARGGYLATRHLIGQGCRRVLFISSQQEDLNKRNREAGYAAALNESGLPADPALRVYLSGAQPSMEEAEQLVGEVIARGTPFDGVFAVSDHAAAGALRALQAAGVRVPNDVRLVGFDDSIYTRLTTPQITSVRRFHEQLAHRGCETLLALIEGQRPPVETVVPVELVERASSR